MYAIDRNNPTPLYEQIKLLIREQIMRGHLDPGMMLPAEAELCKKYSVSRITVRKALDDLAQIGLLERIQGVGTMVSRKPIQSSFDHITGFSGTMEKHGVLHTSKIISIDTIANDHGLCSKFGLPVNSDQRFIKFKRLRFVGRQPAVILTAFVQEELGEKLQEFELNNASFYKLYEKILGRKVIRNEATLTPVIATGEVVELLKVKPGSPHFLFNGLSYVEGDLPVEFAIGTFRGDIFQFSSILYRVREEVVG